MNTLILLAEITAPQGLQGWVRVKCYAENLENLKHYSPLQNQGGSRQFDIKDTKYIGKAATIKIAGIDDRSAAEALRGTQLFVPRQQLPALPSGEYYHSDLLGLTAIDQDTLQVLGIICAIHNFGAGDILEIKAEDDQIHMLPFTKEYMGEPDWQNKTLPVRLAVFLEE